MKKVFVLLAIVGVLFLACDTNGDNDPPSGELLNTKAFSPESIAYIMKDNDTSKSVMASMSRSLVINSVYEFTIIKPKSQTTAGAANGFDTEVINITVENQEPLGNGKTKFEVRRSDNNTTFFITFDSNGMYSIQGLSGAKEGYLNILGDNNNGLDGAYVGYIQDNHGNWILTNVLFRGNMLIAASETIGTPGSYMGSGTSENEMPITSITDNTITLAESQMGRWQTDGEGNTGEQWVPFKVNETEFDTGNTGYIMKSLEYSLNGDILTAKITDIWALAYGWTSPVGIVEFEMKKVPIN